MIINIPCVDCVHFNECEARKVCISDLRAARLTCYDYEPLPQFAPNLNHTCPLGTHLFNRSDGRYSLPDKDKELKLLNEEYQSAVRSNILLLSQIISQLTIDRQMWEADTENHSEYKFCVNR